MNTKLWYFNSIISGTLNRKIFLDGPKRPLFLNEETGNGALENS